MQARCDMTLSVFAAMLALPLLQACAQDRLSTPPSSLATRPAPGDPQFSVRRYGAVGDGRTRDTHAIQSAIDQAGAIGGGMVCFPPGRYLSGGLALRSGVVLQLEPGAVLLASTEMSDYPLIAPAFRSYTNRGVARGSLIYGENLHDVAIVGAGVIDGQGAAYRGASDKGRPYVLRLVTCRGVRVEGVTLRDSPGWMQHYLACDDVTIHGIRVYSHVNYNNDMMDIDCCRDVRISDCIGDTGDDAVTLKSTADRACENIAITNCVLSSHCNALKFGTESNGGFKNITVSNCVIRPSESDTSFGGAKGGLAGIALEIVDGGILDGVTISNIAVRGTRSPLFLRLGNRARPFDADCPKPGIGAFRNVVISDLVATDVGELGCAIAGLPDHPIENVTLNAVTITFPGGRAKSHVSATVPEKPDVYPECTMFGTLPAYAFYCRHVTGLRLSNVDVGWAKPDSRSALVCDDVRDLEVDGFRGQSARDSAPVVTLNDVCGAMLRGCAIRDSASVFLRMQGKTKKVSVTSSDLGAAMSPFEFAGEASAAILSQTGNRLKD